jgi:tetratricopeptide (TPR) repeat protein
MNESRVHFSHAIGWVLCRAGCVAYQQIAEAELTFKQRILTLSLCTKVGSRLECTADTKSLDYYYPADREVIKKTASPIVKMLKATNLAWSVEDEVLKLLTGNDIKAALLLSTLMEGLETDSEALDDHSKALLDWADQMRPDDLDLVQGLAECRLDLSHFVTPEIQDERAVARVSRAAEQLQRVVAARPADSSALILLGKAEAQLGRLSEATSYMEQAESLSGPESVRYLSSDIRRYRRTIPKFIEEDGLRDGYFSTESARTEFRGDVCEIELDSGHLFLDRKIRVAVFKGVIGSQSPFDLGAVKRVHRVRETYSPDMKDYVTQKLKFEDGDGESLFELRCSYTHRWRSESDIAFEQKIEKTLDDIARFVTPEAS